MWNIRALAVIGALWLSTSSLAHADFFNAFNNYKEGKFAEALVQFKELAELGDNASQFNLGVMSVRGEGMEKNPGVGVGWMLAAAENGYTQMAAEKLAQFKSALTPEQAVSADKIVAQYGRRALERNLLPGASMTRCRQFRYAHVEQFAKANFPLGAAQDGRDGIVVVEFTVGVDGLARDVHVLASVPEGVFEDATIDAYLRSRFVPAMRNGEKVESRIPSKFTFYHEDGGALWKLRSIDKVREAAEKRNPNAQYIIGLLGSMDRTLNVPEDEARAMVLQSAQAGHPNAQYWVAHQVQLEQLCGNADKMVTWLEHAAKGGDSNAQIELVHHRIASSPDKIDVQELKQLLSKAASRDNPYAMKHAVAILASSPIQALHDKDLALSTAVRLKKYDNNSDPHIEDAMAAAYAANGNFREAGKLQERAIKKAQKLYWNTQSMEERLANYAAGKPASGDLFAVPPAITAPPPVNNEAEDCSKKKRGCSRVPDKPRTPTGSFIQN